LYNAPKLYPSEKDRLLEGDEGVHDLRQGHIQWDYKTITARAATNLRTKPHYYGENSRAAKESMLRRH